MLAVHAVTPPVEQTRSDRKDFSNCHQAILGRSEGRQACEGRKLGDAFHLVRARSGRMCRLRVRPAGPHMCTSVGLLEEHKKSPNATSTLPCLSHFVSRIRKRLEDLKGLEDRKRTEAGAGHAVALPARRAEGFGPARARLHKFASRVVFFVPLLPHSTSTRAANDSFRFTPISKDSAERCVTACAHDVGRH